jgi:hypothetical protein
MEILKIAGQIAGIGGLGIGIAIIVFRDIIRKNIFPSLTKAHAFKLLTLIAIMVFVIALAGIAAWVYTTTNQSNRIGGNNAESILANGLPESIHPVINFRLPLHTQIRLYPEDKFIIYAPDSLIKKIWVGHHWEDFENNKQYMAWGITGQAIQPKLEYDLSQYRRLDSVGHHLETKATITFTKNRDKIRYIRRFNRS